MTYGVAIGTLLMMIFIIVQRPEAARHSSAGGVAAVAVPCRSCAGWLLVQQPEPVPGRRRHFMALRARQHFARRGKRERRTDRRVRTESQRAVAADRRARRHPRQEWQASIARRYAPNYFLINIDPEQWPEMQHVFHRRGRCRNRSIMPLIRGRYRVASTTYRR